MRFNKYNNPSKRRTKRKLSRVDADIIASKQMFDDRCRGVEMSLKTYDEMSDKLCGKPSRNIY